MFWKRKKDIIDKQNERRLSECVEIISVTAEQIYRSCENFLISTVQ